jgi:hypothetical protein
MESPAPARDYRTLIAATSLVAGPLLMSIGDLFHPEERMDTAEQIVIIVDHASRWYAAHLLLLIGILLSIPGFLALSELTARRKPALGYAARILILVGTTAVASIFVGEMLIGRYVIDGANASAAKALLDTMFSGPIVAAVGPAALAFFAGTAAFAAPLVPAGGKLRWIAMLYAIGAALILAEILSAEVLLSQIGNIVIFFGGVVAASLLLRGESRPATIG